ncbi:MAG: glycoside hydrolase family 13 protein [Roseburia sp.]
MTKEDSVYQFNRIQQYMLQMRPLLKKEALFSDGSSDYRWPVEPKAGEKVTIRFRTAKDNVDAVRLCTPSRHYQMTKTETTSVFDYYSVTLELGEDVFSYCFETVTGLLHVFFDRYGVSRQVREEYMFRIIPGFSTPEWSKGAVMYQILVDRFYNGDTSNDVLTDEYFYIRGNSKKMDDWETYPSEFSVAEFYGGDLEGVRQKLDYLSGLGVEVIYFNPLFVSPSNHKYDIQDYDYIDPHYGVIVEDEGELLKDGVNDNRRAGRYVTRVTNRRNLEASNQLFIRLVEEIHARGMRVIIDGVFNHCGSFHKWLDREEIYAENGEYAVGAFVMADSPYRDYFTFQDKNSWPFNGTYEGWWGHDTLPKLNYEGSKLLYEKMLQIAAKWVSPPYNADGWRLDVAADLGHSREMNHRFWRDFRKTVKAANPNAIILAEHYGDPKEWLEKGDQWDTVMNYDAFMEPLTWFLTGVEKHSDEAEPQRRGRIEDFEGAMRHYMARFQTSQLLSAMNELSNHDHSRFMTRTSGKVGRAESLGADAASEGIRPGVFRAAVVVQMTWPGAPTVYYGDEAGVCGFTDPDNRRTYPWGKEDIVLIDFHRDMIQLHKNNPAFRTGSFRFLPGGENLLCYARFNRKQQFVIVVNNAEYDREVELPVWTAEIPMEAMLERILITTEAGYSPMVKRYEVKRGVLKIELQKCSAVILQKV